MPKDRIRPRKTAAILIWGALILPLVLYVLSFSGELSRTLGYLWNWFQFMFGRPAPVLTIALSRDLQVTLFTLIFGFLFTFFLWLLLTSFQAILPVKDLFEVFQTMEHQLIFILGFHGQAVFIKDGERRATAEEVNRVGPGVVVVDFNSAVVLERLVGPPTSILRPLLDLAQRILHVSGVAHRYGAPEVHGPGVIFTLPYERIRGEVDLRRQTRSIKGISTHTRDGIDIKSNIFAVFSIGQEPDVVQVAYIGERRLQNLRVITTESLPGNKVRVSVQDEELDSQDLHEIHLYARAPNQAHDALPYAPLPSSSLRPVFDKARVFAAVFAQAREQSKKDPLPWTDLPARVAADLFREILSQINYDDLYQPDNTNPNDFPLPEIKRNFRNRVRNTGVLSYRVAFLNSGQPLSNEIYSVSELLSSPIRPLTTPHVLRERGIKVITSGFSNPEAVSPAVRQQRLESWRASWERERAVISASRELEAVRIRNRARALAQRDLTAAMAKIFEQGDLTEEVLAFRVLQALENVSADPKTRQFLPADTIKLMEQIHNWLLNGQTGRALPSGEPVPSEPNPSAGEDSPQTKPPSSQPQGAPND